jgi:hypothetical protein
MSKSTEVLQLNEYGGPTGNLYVSAGSLKCSVYNLEERESEVMTHADVRKSVENAGLPLDVAWDVEDKVTASLTKKYGSLVQDLANAMQISIDSIAIKAANEYNLVIKSEIAKLL